MLFRSSAAPCLAAAPAGDTLDELFDKLGKTESPEIAVVIEARIWDLWLRSGSDSVDLIMTRGLDAIAADDYDTALELFTAATEIKPDFAEGWNKRATVNFLKGDYDKALVDINHVLKLEPRHFGAMVGLAKILESYGEKAKALEAYHKALAIDPFLEGVKENIERLKPEVEGRGI